MMKINPLTITKPEYKDNIEDAYLVGGADFDVMVVVRFTPDMVRKNTHHFSNRDSAIAFINSLYKTSPQSCDSSNLPTTVDSCMDAFNKSDRPQETQSSMESNNHRSSNFSFGDDDMGYRTKRKTIRNEPIVINEKSNGKGKRAKWDL